MLLVKALLAIDFPLRDTNKHRIAQGREKIKLGVKFYGNEDEADVSGNARI